ncbi:MAG: alpha/beta hydrolase [Aureliella sp.]
MHYVADWLELPSESGGTSKKFVHTWTPSSGEAADAPPAIVGNVVIVHGLGEHGGRYHSLAEKLTLAGFRVFAMDQQGHGKDHRPRGAIDSYESLLGDISDLLSWIGSTHDDRTILLGHSMGGNLALNHALRIGSGYRGVIASGPMIRAQRAPGPIAEFLLRSWCWLRPRSSMKSTVIAERLMSDRAEIESFEKDELFHSTLSLKLGAALIDSGRWALGNAHNLSVPMLVAHGDTDVLTCPDASKEFAERAGESCELKIWEGFLHDPFRCEGGDKVVASFVDFARRQLDADRPQ